jgi:methionine synthase II (cobalamin-independent)
VSVGAPVCALRKPAASDSQHIVVLGLLTTKHGRLENAATVEAGIHEAAAYVPLERLALNPQCGFASVEASRPRPRDRSVDTPPAIPARGS